MERAAIDMDQATHNKIVSFIWGIAEEEALKKGMEEKVPRVCGEGERDLCESVNGYASPLETDLRKLFRGNANALDKFRHQGQPPTRQRR
jgi:hypothetical protein